jgi:hypothetical protein
MAAVAEAAVRFFEASISRGAAEGGLIDDLQQAPYIADQFGRYMMLVENLR